MSKENKVVEINEAVETGVEVTNQVATEGLVTKVKNGLSKAKKPLIIGGTFVLGLVAGLVAAKNAGSNDHYDFDEDDFDVEVEESDE